YTGLGVGLGRGGLVLAEGGDVGVLRPLSREREVLDGPLGLGPPLGLGRDLVLAHRVVLDTEITHCTPTLLGKPVSQSLPDAPEHECPPPECSRPPVQAPTWATPPVEQTPSRCAHADHTEQAETVDLHHRRVRQLRTARTRAASPQQRPTG